MKSASSPSPSSSSSGSSGKVVTAKQTVSPPVVQVKTEPGCTSDPVTAGVILHVVKGEEERFMSVFSEEVVSSDWIHWSVGVNINNIVKGAEFVELYFEAKPETVNFNLDNVYMEEWTPGERLYRRAVIIPFDVTRRLLER